MILTDQARVVPALLALREKYRERAIRMQARAVRLVKTAGEHQPMLCPKPVTLAGFMRARDYYISAAEAIDALCVVQEEA